MLSIFLLHPFY